MSLFNIGSLLRGVGHVAEGTGHALGLPDLGVSELFGVHSQYGPSFGDPAQGYAQGGSPTYTATPTPLNPNYNPSGTGGIPTSGGTGGAVTAAPDQAAIDQAKQSYLDQLGILGKNQSVAQQQIGDSLSGAQSTYDQNVSRLNNNFNNQSSTLNQQQGLANDQLSGIEAARGLGGLGDSTYYQRAQGGQNLQYQQAFQGLDQDRATQMDNLNNYLNQAKSQAQLQAYNLNAQDFQTLDQYQSALATINQHIQDIDAQRSRALQAVQAFNPQAASVQPTFDASKSSDAFFNQINNLAKTGVSQKDLQGYINQYYAGDKDKLKNYSNFVNTLFGQQAPQTA